MLYDTTLYYAMIYYTISYLTIPKKDTPFYRRKSLYIEGSPLLSKEIPNYIRKPLTIKEIPFYRRNSLTIEGNPLRIKGHDESWSCQDAIIIL